MLEQLFPPPLAQLRRFLNSALLAAITTSFFVISTPASSAPTIDGLLDAEYGSPIATSPSSNLLAIDQGNPKAVATDVTDLYVTNTSDALYVFVALPNLSLSTMHGSWAIVMHLGGLNDSKELPVSTTGDPYNAPISYSHNTITGQKNHNAVLYSNWKSSAPYSDGVNGWAYLCLPNSAGSAWDYGPSDYLGTSVVAISHPLTTSTGATGALIGYREPSEGQSGAIEVKIPLADFARGATLTAPLAGDLIQFQYYGTVRQNDNSYTRGATDLVPFEDCQPALNIDPPSASNFDPPLKVIE